jgi:hypothetical protein
MKQRVFKVKEEYSGPGDEMAYANENGLINIANKCLLFGNKSEEHRINFGLIQSVEQAIKFLRDEGYCVEEQTDVVWGDGYITFEQGV